MMKNIMHIKKRKILRILIIILCIATIALAILSLIFKFSCIYALVVFLIMAVLRSYRDKLDFNYWSFMYITFIYGYRICSNDAEINCKWYS